MSANKSEETELQMLSKLTHKELIEHCLSLRAHVRQLKGILREKNGLISGFPPDKKPLRPIAFSEYNKRHVFFKVAYLGWHHDGYVIQEDTANTVENILFMALKKTRLIESRETSNYHRAGRTDRGVTAFGQVISIDVRSVSASGLGVLQNQNSSKITDSTDELDYVGMLNQVLPKTIRVLAWAAVPIDASARFDCKKRTYHYYFIRSNLNVDKMREAAKRLEGEHDFRNFCKMDIRNGVVTYVRRIFSTVIELAVPYLNDEDDSPYDVMRFVITGSSYLWHQIRCIMTVLFLIGENLEQPSVIDDLLDIEKCPARPQYEIANELPLVLYDCEYEFNLDWRTGAAACANKLNTDLHACWIENKLKAVISSYLLPDEIPSTLVSPFFISKRGQKKQYKPLLQRLSCGSLASRISYRQQKKKINIPICDTLQQKLDDDETAAIKSCSD